MRIKQYVLLTILTLCSLLLVFFIQHNKITPEPSAQNSTTNEQKPSSQSPFIVSEYLEIPWDFAFLPDKSLLITERTGQLVHVSPDGSKTSIEVSDVKTTGEGGLLGMVLHPKFDENQWLYLYLSSGGLNQTQNSVVRYRLNNQTLTDATMIIEHIPGAIYHDGGRMTFGPDGLLYITTGDASQSTLAQNIDSLAGKILRLHDDGTIPEDNPFGTAVYSYGHRNPQGLTFDEEGHLWSTEHGRSGLQSGLDEINLIQPGQNYGWPIIEGDQTKKDMIAPAAHSGPATTWAPASAAMVNGRLFFGGLRGEALYEAVLDGDKITSVKEHFKNKFGRIRTVRLGPDDMLYFTTSNRDGRGDPQPSDDKLIRIDPSSLRDL